MNMITTILLCLAGVIVLILLAAMLMKKNHFVKRGIVINAPRQKVFDYIRFLNNQDQFNGHAMAGGEREKKYTGMDGTLGYIYAWKGDKSAGEGEKEIKNIIEGKRVEMEIRFTKPMKAEAAIVMETETMADDQTKVSWSNAGILKYPVNILIPVMERSVAKEMDASLKNLKKILESHSGDAQEKNVLK
jgi:hypothetical protein